MKEFMANHIQWHVGTFNVSDDDFAGNITDSSSNNLCSLSQNARQLFLTNRCPSSCASNENMSDTNFEFYLETYYAIFVSLGVISLIGNSIAITHEIQTFINQKHQNVKEGKVYNFAVLNLCLADLLMAVYLIVCPISLVLKEQMIPASLCNAMGVVSGLSLQVSVSILVIITAFRLHGVLYPFRLIRIRTAIVLLLLVWFLWLFVISLPLFNKVFFDYEFTRAILIKNRSELVPLRKVFSNMKRLAKAVNPIDEPYFRVMNQLSNFDTNEVTVQFLQSFNLFNFETSEPPVYEYFAPTRGCTIEMFSVGHHAISYFSQFLLLFNLLEFIFILAAYFIIFKTISTQPCKQYFLCKFRKRHLKTKGLHSQKRKTENRQVYVRIFIVIITDLLCGLPMCLFSLVYFLLSLTDNCFLSESLDLRKFGPIIALFLFPLNSVINPYIYSFQLWKSIAHRLKVQLLNWSPLSLFSSGTMDQSPSSET